MPYLGDVDINDPIYQNTRKFVWSEDNPYLFKGSAGEGIGGPHIGYDTVSYTHLDVYKRQPDTFGSIHRLIHIFNQLFQLRVRSIDLFGLLTNYGMPVKINR